jgi:malonyl-CoA O-methyltransferase
MPMNSHSTVDEYTLDAHRVRLLFDRASRTYARSAVVQGELRARLLERLGVVKLQPRTVLDLGAASGQSSRALKERYPKAQVLALDFSLAMLQEAAHQQRWLRRFERIGANAERLPLRTEAIDLVFSNLMLAWCNDPDAIFRETSRVLRTEGLFTFTTFGPDTLKELRERFRIVDGHTHVHRFIDMHDLGDALLRAGFIEPVMDTERLTVTYPSLRALMRELHMSGAGNATAGRRRTWLGRRHFQTLERAFDAMRTEGAIPLSLEIVYGHAWRGARRPDRAPGHEFVVPISAVRSRVHK